MHINPIAVLRQLKGAPLSVLIALTIVKPRHVSSTWLMGCTGYSGDNITAATWYLKEFGFIDCDSHRSNWRLTEEGVQQLPLPVSLLEPEDTPIPAYPKPANPDPEIPDPNSKPVPYNACKNLLWQAGIGEPMATTLCEMDHVTPEYLKAHIKKAKQDKIDTALLVWRIKKADRIPDPPHDPMDRNRYLLCDGCLHHPSKCTCN
jgi:hypothetical protein